MTEPLLEVRRLVKRFGAVVATAALDLAIMPGELHAVIGPNGAGKTTLIGQLAGEVRPDAGHIYFAGRNITALSVPRRAALGLARSFQMHQYFPRLFDAGERSPGRASSGRAQLSLLASGPLADPYTPCCSRSAKQCGAGGARHSASGTLVTRRTTPARNCHGSGYHPETAPAR